MNDHSSFDLGSSVALLVVIVVLMAAIVRLIPVLFQVVWQLMPGILILTLISWMLRGMVQKLLK